MIQQNLHQQLLKKNDHFIQKLIYFNCFDKIYSKNIKYIFK
jgi:hypothetical protein